MDKLITEITRTECFTGIEAEGPNRGSSVLFVPGSITIERIKKVLAQDLQISRIYYGAGNDRTFSLKVLLLLNEYALKEQLDLDIETDRLIIVRLINSLIENNCLESQPSIIYYWEIERPMSDNLVQENLDSKRDYDKFVFKDMISWFDTETHERYTTFTDDPLFEQDTFIESKT